MNDRVLVSVITPAWNEAANLPAMYTRLQAVADAEGFDWEWIVVDDHSTDQTFEVVRSLAARDARVQGVRLARNSGSHVAIACGLDEARGDAAVVLAADLQDPPETLPTLLERWRAGARVVWAARRSGRASNTSNPVFARVYYAMMRHVIGMRDMPATGADFFLVDRAVVDAFRQFGERHVSVLGLITWLGFSQDRIEYDKQPRLHGVSGWSLKKKVKLVLDSLTAFSSLPITVCWILGVCLVIASLLGAALGFAGLQFGVLTPVAVVLVASVTGVGGLVLLMLGLVGEYVWRALDETRRRPRYVIEARASVAAPEGTVAATR